MSPFVRVLVLVCVLGTFVPASTLLAQTPPAHHDHAGMSMPMDMPIDPIQQAKFLKDKRESEFNHHLSGFFLILAGLLILAQSASRNRLSSVRYAWPICFLLSGVFVLVFSDTELWPFGAKSWMDGILNNREVLQHKTFAVMLLALGSIELARARNKLTAPWSAWIFPAFAIAGSVLLLFHSHDAGMHGPDHMTAMARIQMQHFSYSGAGFGIALSKALAELPNRWQSLFTKLYPVLTMVLGVLLIAYVE